MQEVLQLEIVRRGLMLYQDLIRSSGQNQGLPSLLEGSIIALTVIRSAPICTHKANLQGAAALSPSDRVLSWRP